MVKSHRGGDTHFLSAQEIITAAAYQNLFPNKCKHTDEGVFGSKFVTICVSGNKDNEVHMEGYQVACELVPVFSVTALILGLKPVHGLGQGRHSGTDQRCPGTCLRDRKH